MNLINQLKRHEGIRLKPYRDSVGKLTVGIGRNIDDVPFSMDEVELMLANDIRRSESDLDYIIEGWRDYSEDRKQALTNMVFNLGLTRFRTFKKMIVAINQEDWQEASIQALDSKWATQVGSRANELSDMLRDG